MENAAENTCVPSPYWAPFLHRPREGVGVIPGASFCHSRVWLSSAEDYRASEAGAMPCPNHVKSHALHLHCTVLIFVPLCLQVRGPSAPSDLTRHYWGETRALTALRGTSSRYRARPSRTVWEQRMRCSAHCWWLCNLVGLFGRAIWK